MASERGEAAHCGLPLSFGGVGESLIVGLIVACALAVRLVGVGRGLPYIHEWDEPFVLAPVIKMALFHTLNPGAFVYPSVTFYLLLPVVYAHAAYLHAHGVMTSLKDIILAHPLIPTGYVWYISAPSFYVRARALTALLSTATVYLVYRLGRAAFGAAAGVLAAALLAVAPGAVYYADTVRVDVPVAFFATAALLAGLGVLRRGALQNYLAAGFLTGLAISTKQSAVWLVAPMLIAHVWNERRTALVDPALGLMMLAVAAGVVLGTPYILIRPDLVLAGSRQGLDAYGLHAPAQLAGVLNRIALNLAYFMAPTQGGDWYAVPHSGLGLVPGMAAVAGVVAGFLWRPRIQLYLASFPVLLLLFLARVDVFYLRNLAPVVPLAAIWAAVGSEWVWRRVRTVGPMRHASWRAAGAVAGIVVLLAGPVRESAALAWWFNRHQDTRIQAMHWLRLHAPRGAGVAFELELAWFLPDVDRVPFRVEWTDRSTPPSWYAEKRIEYAVVSEWNPIEACPAVAFVPRPSYLPSVAAEARFVPNSYPVIDPAVAVVRPGMRCASVAPGGAWPAQDHAVRFTR